MNKLYSKSITLISIISLLIGMAVLVGYKFDIMLFKSITPFWLTMKVNSAMCIILAAIALWCLNYYPNNLAKIVVVGCGLIICAFSFLTTAEYLFGIDLGIDNLYFHETYTQPHIVDDLLYPGRVSIATAISLLFLGLSLLLVNFRYLNNTLFQIAVFIVLSIAFFSLLGYFYNINTAYGFTFFTKMALHTSIALILLSIGILLSRPDVGVMRLLLNNDLSGDCLRTLLPVMFIVPLFVGFIENVGEKLDLYDPAFGDNLQVAFTIIILSIIVIKYARSIEQHIDNNK